MLLIGSVFCLCSQSIIILSALPVCVHVWTSVSGHDWWWPPEAHSTSFGQWFPLMAPSGEDAGGNGEEKEEEEGGVENVDVWKEGLGGRSGWRVGRGEGGMKRMTDLLGLGWNAPFLPNLLLYFEKQQEGCRGRKEAGDGWSDMRALTALMNGSSTKWTHHHGGDRGRQKRQRTFHYWGMIALTKWAFCHGVIFELLFAQKV